MKLCGYGNGGDRKSNCQNGTLKLADIAKQLGTSERNLQRALSIEHNLTDSTNIRQRGDVGGAAKKVGLRIKELDRIYENSRGGDRKSNPNNYGLNHEQMAKMMGVSVSTLENYKKLTEMIPELEELVDTGIATPTTALAIMRSLSEEDQLEMISSLDTTKKITQKQVQQYIKKIKQLETNNPKVKELENQISDLKVEKSVI